MSEADRLSQVEALLRELADAGWMDTEEPQALAAMATAALTRLATRHAWSRTDWMAVMSCVGLGGTK